MSKYDINTPKSIFWDAIRFNVGSVREEDRADVGIYVASRGEADIRSFIAARDRARSFLIDQGAFEAMRRHGYLPDGGRCDNLSNPELLGLMDSLLLRGYYAFQGVLREISNISFDPLYAADLAAVVNQARSDPRVEEGAIWQMSTRDLRSDGEPWLDIGVGFEYDVPEEFIPNSNIEAFERFRKASLLASRNDLWRRARAAIGARTIDVLLEYESAGGRESSEVLRRGRKTEVEIHRPCDRGDQNLDPISFCEIEAGEVLRIAHEALIISR